MFDIGWSELLVIGIVALIVVGPKDLPKMFKTLGQMMAKARGMAREFQRAMEDAADASGVKDVARDLRGMADPQGMGLDELKKFKNWDPLKPDVSAPKPPAGPAANTGPAVNSGPTPADTDDFDSIIAEMDGLRRDKAADARPAPAPAAGPTPDTSPKPDAAGPKA